MEILLIHSSKYSIYTLTHMFKEDFHAELMMKFQLVVLAPFARSPAVLPPDPVSYTER